MDIWDLNMGLDTSELCSSKYVLKFLQYLQMQSYLVMSHYEYIS